MPDKAFPSAPLALQSRDAARALGITERLLTSLSESGQLRCVRLGKVTLYPVSCLRAWLEREATGKPV